MGVLLVFNIPYPLNMFNGGLLNNNQYTCTVNEENGRVFYKFMLGLVTNWHRFNG